MRMPTNDQEDAKFSMAPMIDMVFLLLVFFMTASHLSSSTRMKMDIPTASHGVVPRDRPDRWIVNITREGHLFSGDVPVTVDELKAVVAERVAADPNTKVYLRADSDTEHKEIKDVMSAMAEAGIDSFIFGVYVPTASEPGGAP